MIRASLPQKCPGVIGFIQSRTEAVTTFAAHFVAAPVLFDWDLTVRTESDPIVCPVSSVVELHHGCTMWCSIISASTSEMGGILAKQTILRIAGLASNSVTRKVLGCQHAGCILNRDADSAVGYRPLH